MLPEFSLLLALAFIVGAIGILFVFNGFRGGFYDEVIFGAVMLVIAWFLTTL